ncbi:MAG: hypothetical protein Kow0092_37110 [Deferrisomatales bacterium]
MGWRGRGGAGALAVVALLAAGCAAGRHAERGPAAARSEAPARPADNPTAPPERVGGGEGGTEEDIEAALAELEEELEEEEEGVSVSDPLEPLNRGFFWVNDKLYFYLFKPFVRVYRVLVPEPARVSVANFLYNLEMPLRFVNKTLQLKVDEAGYELVRFFVNTTAGIGGLFDPADGWDALKKKEEDLGQTFGRYGAGEGLYLVIPVLGPSNLRDGLGTVGDWFLNPLRYLLSDTVRLGTAVADRATYLSLDEDTYEQIVEQSLDPYLFIRSAYTQKRRADIEK